MNRPLPAHVLAALRDTEAYAYGGSVRPAPMFAPIPLPSVATPGLASPRGLLGAHHRQHFADGGSTLPPHVVKALRILEEHRKHFDDGGDAEGGSRSSSGNANGEGDGGSGNGPSGDGGSGGDHGDGNSAAGAASGAGGGVGGFGGGSNDGDNGAAANNSSASRSGGGSDASTGGADRSTAPSGGQSDAATGGADQSTAAAGGGLGAVGGYGSATSGPVGSIGGSAGAPAAGGFSTAANNTEGGFGNFSAGPAATSNVAGTTAGTMTASSLSGQTAGQSMASEAADGAGEAGEDGTSAALGNVSTAAAFGSFGPNPSSPYGAAPSGLGLGDGTTGSVPSSVAASNPDGVGGLSVNGQQLGAMGIGGVDAGAAAPAGYAGGLGAYGLSTGNVDDSTTGTMPGFDNFNSAGDVTQSSLGAPGYTGGFGFGPQASINGDLAGPEGYAGPTSGLPASVSTAAQPAFGNVGQPSAGAGIDPGVIGGMFGDIGDIVGGIQDARNQPVAGPVSVSTAPTGAVAGLNADGDPVGVDGTSALTIHGNLAPGTAMMSDGVPTNTTGTGLPSNVGMQDGIAQTSYGAMGLPSGLPSYAAGEVAQSNFNPGVDPSPDVSQDQATAGVVSPSTIGDYTSRMQAFESGMDPNAVSPTGAVGLSQFTQGTWSGVAQNYPGLGLPATPAEATPAQYTAATNALTNENVAALENAGITPTFGATYLSHNIGIGAAISALSQPDGTPIGAAGIPASSMAVNPAVFGGVQTVGDLKSKLDSIMGTGTVDATTSSQPALTVHSIGEALGDGTAAQVGRYTGAGTGMSDIGNLGLGGLGGIGTMGTGDFGQAEQDNTGKYGTITAHDYSATSGQSSGFANGVTTAHDPSGVSAFGGMAAQQADPATGNFSAEGVNPASEAGYTDFNGQPLNFDSRNLTVDPGSGTDGTSTTAPDATSPAFSINPKISNIAAGVGLGMLGPIGMGLAGANMVSGLFGGPTIGDGINGLLSGSGGGSPVGSLGGQGDNSNQPGAETYGAAGLPGGLELGTSDPGAVATASGVNPYDPQATANAAYQAALAGEGTGKSTSSTATETKLVRGRPVHTKKATPLYRPMEDPIVRRALGLD